MRKKTVVISVFAWVLISVSSYAVEPVVVFFDVDFNSDTIGQTASAAAFVKGVTSTKPTRVIENPNTTAGPETAKVVASLGGLTDKPVEWVSTENVSGAPNIIFDSGNGTATSGVVRVEWDFYLNAYTARTSGAAETVAAFYIKGNSGVGVLAITFGVGASPASGGNISQIWGSGWDAGADATWTFSTVYHMIIEIDLDNDTYSVWKNTTQIATALALTSEKDTYRLFESKDGRGVGGDDGQATIGFDNITIKTVPPPPAETIIIIQ